MLLHHPYDHPRPGLAAGAAVTIVVQAVDGVAYASSLLYQFVGAKQEGIVNQAPRYLRLIGYDEQTLAFADRPFPKSNEVVPQPELFKCPGGSDHGISQDHLIDSSVSVQKYVIDDGSHLKACRPHPIFNFSCISSTM